MKLPLYCLALLATAATVFVSQSTPLSAAVILADLAGDFQVAAVGQTSQTVNGGAGIADTAGTGSWNYLQANGGGSNSSLLTYQNSPGNSGNAAYAGSPGASEGSFAMPAISNATIFSDGVAPPPGSVNVHPGNDQPHEIIARWTAGETGLVNIGGSIRDVLPSSSGVAYVVRVNGTDQFFAPTSSAGRENGFNLLLNINAGDTVDLVVGPNGGYAADESHAQMRVSQLTGNLVANLGGDYNESGLPISATGSGTWQYFASDNPNIDATANEVALTVGNIGNAGSTGYGGSGNGFNLPAVSNQQIFVDGEAPLANELAFHPGDSANLNPTTTLTNIVLRWTAGADEGGLANITGNIRNTVSGGDGIEFQVLVDGTVVFDTGSGSSDTLPLTYFDLFADVLPGSTVDFVLSNNGDLFADESVLSAFITVTPQNVPEPSTVLTWTLVGLGLLGFRRAARRHRQR